MFKQRFLSSIVLVFILLFFLMTGKLPLFVFTWIISLIGYFEMTKATLVRLKDQKWSGLEAVGAAGVCAYYGVLYFTGLNGPVMLVFTLTISCLMLVYVFTFPKYEANQVMAAVFSFFYAPVMLSYLYLTRQLEQGVYLIWLTFIGSWICDTCAYLAGRAFGKHKLAPVLSPKKSVEGSVGGVLGAALVGFLYAYVLVKMGAISTQMLWIYPVITTLCSLFSQVGDLAASGIKRNHNIKDYGKLIPGHGGIMDRFDSVIFIAPIIYYLALFLTKVK